MRIARFDIRLSRFEFRVSSLECRHPPMVTITSGVERFVKDVQSEDARPDESAPAAEPAPAVESAPAVEPAKINIDLGYTPFPKQQEFHKSPAKYRLFGGAAGPGKSKALLMEAIIQAHEARQRQHAPAAPHVSRTRANAAALFSPRRSARPLHEFPGIEAPGHMEERLNHALRLLPERARRLPVSGRGISFHRH